MKYTKKISETIEEINNSKNEYFIISEEISENNNEFFYIEKNGKISGEKNKKILRTRKTHLILCLIVTAIILNKIVLSEQSISEEVDIIIEETPSIVETDNINNEVNDLPVNNEKTVDLESNNEILWGGKLKIEKEHAKETNTQLEYLFTLHKSDINEHYEAEEVKINDETYFIIVYYSEWEDMGDKGDNEYQVIMKKNGEFVSSLIGTQFLYPPIGDTGLNMDFNKVYDLYGNLICDFDNENYFPSGVFRNGLCPVSDNNFKSGYINIKGDIVIPCIYDRADSFQDGVAYVEKGTEHMYINTNGNRIIDDRYDFAGKFGKGLCRIYDKESQLYGYIDTNGKIVIPCIYDFASDFNNYDFDFNTGLTSVKLEGRDTIINTKGEDILGTNLRMNYGYLQFDYGLFIVQDINTYLEGIIDINGNLKIPCIYEEITVINEQICKVSLKGDEYYINLKNERTEKPEGSIESNYEEEEPFNYIPKYTSTELLYMINGTRVYNFNNDLIFEGGEKGIIVFLNNNEFYYDDNESISFYRYIVE